MGIYLGPSSVTKSGVKGLSDYAIVCLHYANIFLIVTVKHLIALSFIFIAFTFHSEYRASLPLLAMKQ